MNLKTYTDISTHLLEKAAAIETAKRPSYTIGSEDVLANFKRIAERTGQKPGQILATYMLKHIDSITAALCNPDIPQAEEIEGRFADGINYLKLGYALLREQDHTTATNTVIKLSAKADHLAGHVFIPLLDNEYDPAGIWKG